jgi:hypothetical protein
MYKDLNSNRKLGTKVEGFARFLGQYVAMRVVFDMFFKFIFWVIGIVLLFKIIAEWVGK